MLLPIERMWHRVEFARDEDTTFFLHLMYAGEFLAKLITAGFIAAIADDREGHRYRLTHKLVRADGLGEWTQALDEALGGPAAQHLVDAASEDRRAFTERRVSGTWQHEAVTSLSEAVHSLGSEADQLPTRIPLRLWFPMFVSLRNKTRGHGATTPQLCAKVSPDLERSMKLIIDNLGLLKRPWAYLHRNLSGKYRVLALGGNMSTFDKLKTSAGVVDHRYRSLADGIYIDFNEFARVDLLDTTVDLADFFVPNGGFNGRTFELLSPISDNRKPGDATPYLAPAGERPPSETEGKGALDPIGDTWANLPPASKDYVQRPELENELYQALNDDRHPVITLIGRGGIGKTSLAIPVVQRIAHEATFEAIIWFSARDIDLLPEGPKVVAPRVLSQADIADQFVGLLEPRERNEKGFKALDYLARSLTQSPLGKPILFVFDNFETVRSPGDLFAWLDLHIRMPNKILITTRYRDFKADYPIEVSGMTEEEAEQLIETTAKRLEIQQLLTKPYKAELYEESDGHPYIMKVLLGEVAKARRLVKVERIVAGKDEVLDALFERTYAGLQPVAKRVFLTLCSWRSLVPEVALEAVLLRPANEKMDIAAAVDELVRSSFVERKFADDGTTFLDVALVASVFGRRKLEISPMRTAIDADVRFLQELGATSSASLRHGMLPRLERLFTSVATRVSSGETQLADVVPSLEFICRHYSPAWLMLAALYEESGSSDALPKAAECLRRFLEQPQPLPGQRTAWEELARIYAATNDWSGAAQALIRLCKLPDTPYFILSNTANRLNNLLRDNSLALDSEEKRVLYRDLAHLMEARMREADATDLSRLAWLHLHLRDPDRAREIAEQGLDIESDNEHCSRLLVRLSH